MQYIYKEHVCTHPLKPFLSLGPERQIRLAKPAARWCALTDQCNIYWMSCDRELFLGREGDCGSIERGRKGLKTIEA